MSVSPPDGQKGSDGPGGGRQMTPLPKQPGRPRTQAPWSLQVATVAGIPIRLHFTFLLFLLWVGLRGHGSGLSLGLVLALFLCVVLHELGHSLVALRYGIPVADITLYPIGGVASIEKRPTAKQELWIAVAGPAVNLVIATVLCTSLYLSGGMLPAEAAISESSGLRGFVEVVAMLNITLLAFNMIPAFPMDGGRVLRAIMAMYIPAARATAIASSIGQMIAIAAGLYAFFSQPPNFMLMFIAVFVYMGAGQEAFSYKQASLMEGVRVRQAMITDVRSLAAGNTLKEAADILLGTSQHDFPVVHGDEVIGMLTRDGLLRGLANEGPGAYVAGTMNRDFAYAGPEDDLGEVIPRVQNGMGALIVLADGPNSPLVGLVTSENVAEFFAVRQIAAKRDAREQVRGPYSG